LEYEYEDESLTKKKALVSESIKNTGSKRQKTGKHSGSSKGAKGIVEFWHRLDNIYERKYKHRHATIYLIKKLIVNKNLVQFIFILINNKPL